ncbi:MAG: SulP family inorganic anion transporter [Xanthobacteraceae bacterium]|nr:SulP family inorganic anion transporter [Xanthobacteraceae bacterium]
MSAIDTASRPRSWPLFASLAGYRLDFLSHDLVAGLTLAAIAIPEQMATSRLGGFAPEIGFYAFVAGALAFAAFGGSRFLSCGADSTITPIFAGVLATLAAGSPNLAMLAATLAVMVGVVLVLGGLFRLGWIADLLSIPVTTGFLAGIAAHIVVSQLPEILGLPAPGGTMLQKLFAIAAALGATNPYALAIGLGVFAVIMISERTDARIPGALIGLAAASTAVVGLGLEARGVAVIGALSVAKPSLVIPEVSVSQILHMLPLALIVAVVTMVQTAATTRSFPSDPETPPDVNRDFVGVGAGSIMAGLFGAFPVDASPPRTAIVAETGGRSQLASLIAAAIVAALLLLGAALLRHVPLAALGGVLLFVAQRIVRVRDIAAVFRQSFGEFLLIVATAAAIIVLPIEQGAAIGIVLSLLHGIFTVTRARVTVYERVPGTTIWWPTSPNVPGERVGDVLVVGFQAPLSFLNAYDFRHDCLALLQACSPKPRLLVIEATGIVEIDFTAARVLRDIIKSCRADGVDVAVARLESTRAQDAVTRFGIAALLGDDHLTRSVEEAVRRLEPKR